MQKLRCRKIWCLAACGYDFELFRFALCNDIFYPPFCGTIQIFCLSFSVLVMRLQIVMVFLSCILYNVVIISFDVFKPSDEIYE